jgi:hypothetical protein
MKKNYKLLLEVVTPTEVKGIQQKLNTWMTTRLLKKFDIIPLQDGSMLFRILLHNDKPE